MANLDSPVGRFSVGVFSGQALRYSTPSRHRIKSTHHPVAVTVLAQSDHSIRQHGGANLSCHCHCDGVWPRSHGVRQNQSAVVSTSALALMHQHTRSVVASVFLRAVSHRPLSPCTSSVALTVDGREYDDFPAVPPRSRSRRRDCPCARGRWIDGLAAWHHAVASLPSTVEVAGVSAHLDAAVEC